MKMKRTRPPKCRFKPGQFLREKGTGDLYCIRIIYRTIMDPHEWKYYIEERKDLATPDTELSKLVEKIAGQEMKGCIKWDQPVKDYDEIPGVRNFYHFGDSKSDVPNRVILNDYILISSGELS
jgi:hypothetical protein